MLRAFASGIKYLMVPTVIEYALVANNLHNYATSTFTDFARGLTVT